MREKEGLVAAIVETGSGSWQRNAQEIKFGTDIEREFAGEFYLQIARYEHASIASFHRFAMELMQFGAPAELLEMAQKAATDEVRHAQSAFSIGNKLLGTSQQPGKLDINIAFHQELVSFASAILEEAAIQETLGVLIATEQLRVCKDETIAQYLREVVTEESEHSELAYASLRWCVEIGGEEIKTLIRERLEQPFTFSLSQFPEIGIDALGLPSQDAVKEAIDRGLRSVVIPSLRSLLD